MTALLETRGVTQRSVALSPTARLDLVGRGEIVAYRGPNGAGKSTMFNLIAGVMRPNRRLDCLRTAGLSRGCGGGTAASARHRPYLPGVSRVSRTMSVIDNGSSWAAAVCAPRPCGKAPPQGA